MSLSVHRFESDIARFGIFSAPTKAEGEWMFEVDGRSLKRSWKPWRANVVSDDSRRPLTIGDISEVGTVPVLSDKAVQELRVILERYGEILPLTTNVGEAMYVYNVTNIVDCLDKKHTPGLWLDATRLAEAERYAFVPARVRAAGIFRIPEQQSGHVFVTGEIARTIRATNLTAFALTEVWSEHA